MNELDKKIPKLNKKLNKTKENVEKMNCIQLNLKNTFQLILFINLILFH